jgi:hypothetical protein
MKDYSEPGALKGDASTELGGFTRSVMMWSHERGTLQYDILCALILAFVFFVPKSCFAPKPGPHAGQSGSQQTTVTGSPAVPPK